MSIILCIDPGLRGSGAAIFKDNALQRADYVKNVVESGRGYASHVGMAFSIREWVKQEDFRLVDILRVVIEHPRIYPGAAQQKGDPNDLLDVTGCGSAVAGLFPYGNVITVFPQDWKGQTPKKIMNERVLNALTAVECGRGRLSGHKAHNTLDAIGIGLYFLGRIGKRAMAS